MIVYFIEKLKIIEDQIDMQRDLDALMDWGSTWGMKFNAKKCNIMRVSRSRKPLQHFYSLCNEILQEVSDAKYLGIQIDNKLDRRVPMWQQSGTLLFGSCHGIARFLVDESQI